MYWAAQHIRQNTFELLVASAHCNQSAVEAMHLPCSSLLGFHCVVVGRHNFVVIGCSIRCRLAIGFRLAIEVGLCWERNSVIQVCFTPLAQVLYRVILQVVLADMALPAGQVTPVHSGAMVVLRLAVSDEEPSSLLHMTSTNLQMCYINCE